MGRKWTWYAVWFTPEERSNTGGGSTKFSLVDADRMDYIVRDSSNGGLRTGSTERLAHSRSHVDSKRSDHLPQFNATSMHCSPHARHGMKLCTNTACAIEHRIVDAFRLYNKPYQSIVENPKNSGPYTMVCYTTCSTTIPPPKRTLVKRIFDRSLYKTIPDTDSNAGEREVPNIGFHRVRRWIGLDITEEHPMRRLSPSYPSSVTKPPNVAIDRPH